MVTASGASPSDTVLEIGPGRGALTRALLESGARVIAVETDASLISVLAETFPDAITNRTLTLIHADIRTWDQKEVRRKPYKLVANIPYYITGEIVRMFLEAEHQPTSMTLLVQKEVAERMVARDGKESVLSLSVQAYGTPCYVGKVPARDFSPAPKVDSAIIHIRDISKTFFIDCTEKQFFTAIKAGFSSKRKKAVNNLSNLSDKKEVVSILSALGLTEARPETIHIKQWKKIAQALRVKTVAQ